MLGKLDLCAGYKNGDKTLCIGARIVRKLRPYCPEKAAICIMLERRYDADNLTAVARLERSTNLTGKIVLFHGIVV